MLNIIVFSRSRLLPRPVPEDFVDHAIHPEDSEDHAIENVCPEEDVDHAGDRTVDAVR